MTINAGLRYDLTFNPPYGTSKQIGQNGGPETGDIDFNTGTYIVQWLPPLCSVRGFAPCIPGSGALPANVVVSPNKKIIHNTYTNLGPSFGFAYKVTDRTVVRGAFGIVFDNWAGVLQLAQNIAGLWPDIGQQQAVNLNVPKSSSATPTVTSQDPFASAGNSFFPAPTPFAQVGFMYDPNLKNPYSEQWNFGVQQLLSSSTTVTVNYVGSSSHRLDVGGMYNTALTPGTGDPSHALCFPTLLRRIMIAAQAMAITTRYRSRWRGGTPTVSRTEWPTPGQSPSMSEAMDISALKAAFRRTPITRLAMIGLCQDLI